MRLHARSVDATRALAQAISPLLERGDVIVLAGDLGAGKTTFTQALAASLGVTAPVTSPTFTLVQEYEGRMPIVHIDVYRLQHLQEVHDLGFDEMVEGDALAIVEWGDLLGPLLPHDRLQLAFDYDPDDEGSRIVSLALHGASWVDRTDGVARVVAPFGGA